jgi:NAD(P)-dependent dehydrogenase (short-subunit alcohol dehydrogenase family)
MIRQRSARPCAAAARRFKENAAMTTPASDAPVWFVTGCSTGLGREFARAALARGFRVVATARDPLSISDLVKGKEGQAIALKLAVAEPAAIAAAVHEAERVFGRIDVLINNAGYGYMASVEEGEDAAIRAQFETNFFGLAAMTRAVLPGMRKRRSGGVVNISSVGGLRGSPAGGYYCATKHAVNGLSESLALEVEPLGIRVMIVEPGPFRTDWGGRSLQHGPTGIADYEATAHQRQREIGGYSGTQAGDPVRAAEAVIGALLSPHPPRHLVLGRFGLDIARAKFRDMLQGLDAWETVSLGADFPGAGAA